MDKAYLYLTRQGSRVKSHVWCLHICSVMERNLSSSPSSDSL